MKYDLILVFLICPAVADPSIPFYTLHLIRILAKRVPGWMSTQPALLELLQARWRCPSRLARIAAESELSREQVLESKRLAKCLLSHLRTHPEECATLFELFSIYQVRCCTGSIIHLCSLLQ